MKVEMHDIKGGQLAYYRKTLVELDESIVEATDGLHALEIALESISNDYAINIMKHSIREEVRRIECMMEVYSKKVDNPSISDSEVLEIALNKRKEKSEYLKTHARSSFKNKVEYESFIKKCQCDICKGNVENGF